MFTGLIEQTGVVKLLTKQQHSSLIGIAANFSALISGESIAVNGVCLTLLPNSTEDLMLFDISPETLAVTNLSLLSIGSAVNLERAMLASARFGGHYVSGHVDTTAVVTRCAWVEDNYFEICISGFSATDNLYLLPKGSITVNGVSLTINSVNKSATNLSIELLLVPHTVAQTTLGQCVIDDCVNIEFDYLTRIVAHQLRIKNNDSCI
jgi:riboflavin synthase